MMNRYIIKFDKKEDVLKLERQFLLLEDLKNKIYLNHYFYEEESIDSDYFLFFQSIDISIDIFFKRINICNISDDKIIEVNDLPEDILSELEIECPNTIYVTNFPKKFTLENLINLLSSLPDNLFSTIKLNIERLPCVFKITFNDTPTNKNWIKSILCFIPNIHFTYDNTNMSVETNCLKVPVIHFINLPQSIATIEYFIELMRESLGKFKLYEQNSMEKLSCNISYETNDETWDVIDQLNFQAFEGKELKVNHFIDIKFLQKMSKFNIKVTNYEGSFDSFDIYENFQKFGSIYSIYNNKPVIDNGQEEENTIGNDVDQKNEISKSKNDYFCIQYYLKECALDAINNAPDVLNMKNLILTTKEAGIVVYNFENNVTIEKVKSFFPCATSITIQKSNDKNQRPFVFVNFISQEDCDEAAKKCKTIYMDHLRLMSVSQEVPKKQAFNMKKLEEEKCQQKNTVFIQGIPKSICTEDIIQKCAIFGDIDSAVYIDMKKKKAKNVAKISFNSEQAFHKALNSSIILNDVKMKLKKYIPQKNK